MSLLTASGRDGRTTPAAAPTPRPAGGAQRFLGYAWGIIVRPRRTIDALARETSILWAVIVAALGAVQVWGNMLLFAAFGQDWLGTRPLLTDPTYVGGFGYQRVPAAAWVPVFAAYMPVGALLTLAIVPGVAQVLSKVWGGQGRFEQMVNVLTFATVPALALGWLSEWLTGVPLILLTGERYFYVAAMRGAFGPTVAALWTAYSIAIYTVPWVWEIALGVLAIRRVQRIPGWAATLVMLVGFALSLLIESTFVR